MNNRVLNKIWFLFRVLILLIVNSQNVRAESKEINFEIFTQEDGLPNNQIQYIYQDSKGWIWIGTSYGLSRFDGYSFVNFLPNPNDSNSLKGNLVRVIKEDKNGNLLVGTENGGLNVFDREKERFSSPYKNHPEFKDRDVSVNTIVNDQQGNIWIGTDFNIFVIDSVGNLSPIYPRPANFEGNFVRRMQFDRNGKIWISTDQGIFIYNPGSNEMETFELPFKNTLSKEIMGIYLDEDGLMWIGTYSSGLFLVDPETRNISKINLSPNVERSELVRTISKGVFGEYWIGTRAGLYVYSKSEGVTAFYQHDERKPQSLSHNSVLSVFHDAQGETWIGTRTGLNLLARSKQVFQNFTALPDDNRYLNSNVVHALWVDSQKKIWVGTEDGGINIYDPARKTYKYLMHDKQNSNSISQNCIKAFQEDGKGNLWVGTFLGGIDIINLKTGKISNFKYDPSKQGTIRSNEVWDFCLDKNGEMWIATSRGVDLYIKESESFVHYPQISGEETVRWIETDSAGNIWFGSANNIIVFNTDENTIRRYAERTRSMFQDSKDRIWIATNDKGIALYTVANGASKYYNESNGLSNNQALRIEEDIENNLWISTANGLSKFNPEKEFFRNFTSSDGLSNNQFCYGASCKTASGELLFGTVSGFNIFNPAEIVSVDEDAPIVFTDLKIFNKSVVIGDNKNSVLEKSISETSSLILQFNQDVFTLDFAALNYVNSDKNEYSYILEGFNRDWNEPSKIRSATYTNLDPGDYLLRIKRILPGVDTNPNELQLKIIVLPPYWKTNWFISLVILFILSLGYFIARLVYNREKMKQLLVLEKINARKLHEVDMMKLKFFTNISHEIRTPLTLIIGPLNKLILKDYSKEVIQENLKIMLRNANNLDRLISQLLDFRKLQTGNLKLNLTEADIVEFTGKIVDSFHEMAIDKEITLKFSSRKKSLNAAFDADKIEKIVNNLISNAFKFTDHGGTIKVNLAVVLDSNNSNYNENQKDKQYIEIKVKDTGRGISENNLNKIFQRFFQSETERGHSGVGIGLALVKELVEIHKGNVHVSSKPGKGTTFTIRIPYYSGLYEQKGEIENHLDKTEAYLQKSTVEVEEQELDPMDSKIMLIVEDNPDVRTFISTHFASNFKIVQAKNGEEGWKLALQIIPDIIISDILMPLSDGYELCKRIKNDERTSHIPILLLTALHSRENEIKGLSTGADDYITKPFDLSVLQAKVENMLSIRESLKQKYTRTVLLEPKNVEISSPDERFLQNAIEIIESNISDNDFGIENFASLIGVSRMQLYRKLQALTDMTVLEFIHHIRLKRAAQLLVQEKMNISEIAYEVGYNDLSHFRRCFKRKFGMSASEYVADSKRSSQ